MMIKYKQYECRTLTFCNTYKNA